MRFLVDECTGPSVARWLRQQGFDAVSVYGDRSGIDDEAVIQWASDEARVLVTNDKGFGERVFRTRAAHHGVILLRLEDERSANKIAVLSRVLEQEGDRIEGRFVVATSTGVRVSEV